MKPMTAFDRLPRQVRDRLNVSPINVRADLLLADMRRCRWTAEQAIAFIARLEAAAPSLIATAARTATNELALQNGLGLSGRQENVLGVAKAC